MHETKTNRQNNSSVKFTLVLAWNNEKKMEGSERKKYMHLKRNYEEKNLEKSSTEFQSTENFKTTEYRKSKP